MRMYLQQHPDLQNLIWQQFSTLLLEALKPILGERYPGVFTLGDYKTLLAINEEQVAEVVARAEIHVLEGIIVTGLQEILEPLTYKSRLEVPYLIRIESLFQLGYEHQVRVSEAGLHLEGIRQSRPKEMQNPRVFEDIDTLVAEIGRFEQTLRQEKSLLKG